MADNNSFPALNSILNLPYDSPHLVPPLESQKKRSRHDPKETKMAENRPTQSPKVSFANKLKSYDFIGSERGGYDPTNFIDEQLNFIEEENGYLVKMQEETRSTQCKHWKDALVVKLVGANHFLGYMR